MRRFKSLGAGGWKSAILKIKMNKKKPAFTLALGALSIFCFLMIAQSFVFLTNGAFAAIQSDRVAAQAQANSFLDISMYQENSRCTNTRCPWELSVSEDFFVSRQMDTPWAS